MRPRIGALGLGWIGMKRLSSLHATGVVDVAFVADISEEAAHRAAQAFGAVAVAPEDLLDDVEVEGIVIATPSALHGDEVLRALRRDRAVFCQKPLALTGSQAEALIAAARDADCLLGVDMSYRGTAAVEAMVEHVRAGGIGDVYAADLVFHNAYGPDKAWFHDVSLAGGGCVQDLGIHLVDLSCMLLDWPNVETVTSRLFAGGVPLEKRRSAVEDYAVARLDFSNGATASLSCSWNLHAGVDAVIAARFYGTSGSVALENVAGSFYDFVAVLRRGTSEEVIASPPDDWGGRMAAKWAVQLADGGGFDPSVERAADVARILDRVYGR